MKCFCWLIEHVEEEMPVVYKLKRELLYTDIAFFQLFYQATRQESSKSRMINRADTESRAEEEQGLNDDVWGGNDPE
jgi:hypothetical protein